MNGGEGVPKAWQLGHFIVSIEGDNCLLPARISRKQQEVMGVVVVQVFNLSRQRRVGLCEFEVSLNYLESSKPVGNYI